MEAVQPPELLPALLEQQFGWVNVKHLSVSLQLKLRFSQQAKELESWFGYYNETAIRLTHNSEFQKRAKHIRIRHFFVRKWVEVKKTSSADQLADILTKAVFKPCLQRILDKLGLKLIDVGKC